MKLTSCIPVIFTVVACGASAVDLNSPPSKVVTIGSEIERGGIAAGQCSINDPPSDYSACINGVAARAAEAPSNHNPFLLGLYLVAWTSIDIHVRVDELYANTAPSPRPTVPAIDWASEWFRKMRVLQARLGVSDDQLFASAKILMVDSTDIRQRLAFYSRRAPPL